MSRPDLHPDELLDKDARGELSGSERTSLDDHLARCAVCRFERRARLDFQDLAADSSLVEVDQLVAKVLVGASVERRPRVSAARRGRRMSPLLVAAVAAAMTVSVAAVAARWTGVWSSTPELVAPAPSPAPSPSAASRTHGHGGGIPRSAELEDVPAPDAPIAIAPVISPVPPSVRPAARAPSAAALFSQANQARAGGQHTGAVRSYRELLVRFPGSPEARLSRATLGRLLLDDGDATAALVLLDAYLRDGDLTLREEAMANRATALGRMGRTGEEAAEWAALLDSYPQSIHATRARARIGELGPR